MSPHTASFWKLVIRQVQGILNAGDRLLNQLIEEDAAVSLARSVAKAETALTPAERGDIEKIIAAAIVRTGRKD